MRTPAEGVMPSCGSPSPRLGLLDLYDLGGPSTWAALPLRFGMTLEVGLLDSHALMWPHK